MFKKISFSISITSIILAIILIAWFYLLGGKGGLEGAAWILGILGAPVTFLDFLLYKFGIVHGFMQSFIAIIFLYLIQYQLIASLFRRNILNFKNKLGLFLIVVTGISIVSSAIIMANIIFAKP